MLKPTKRISRGASTGVPFATSATKPVWPEYEGSWGLFPSLGPRVTAEGSSPVLNTSAWSLIPDISEGGEVSAEEDVTDGTEVIELVGVGVAIVAERLTLIFVVRQVVFISVELLVIFLVPVTQIFNEYVATLALFEIFPESFAFDGMKRSPAGRLPVSFHRYGGPFPPVTFFANE